MHSIQSLNRRFAVTACVAAFGFASAHAMADARVSIGSPPSPFSQNKQNEPGLAVNPINPSILAAGANDEIDVEACAAGDASTCPFTPGVGVSGVYFSFDGGTTWTQPTYTGWTARHCLGTAECVPTVGSIGTLPSYYENGLASDGDPAHAFGPKLVNGSFSWANGARLYYANLTSNFSARRSERAFRGDEAVAVSRTDDVFAAATGNAGAWLPPVIVTRQNSALFSDKESIWADNAASSPYFGNVYLCNVAFQGNGAGPMMLSRSTDGGDTWTTRQISQAAETFVTEGRAGSRQGCTVRTDSRGAVYVFWLGSLSGDTVQLMTRSTNGGRTFDRPRAVATVNEVGAFDASQFDVTIDGVAGSRTNSYPSVDVANGAPTGVDATDRIVLAWADGALNEETALVQYSDDSGKTWSNPVNAAALGDRPNFPAIAISPDGRNVYLTYNAFLAPWQETTANPRPMQGVVRGVNSGGVGNALAWATLFKGPLGDARSSSANALTSGFLGDYNYAVATRDFAVLVWNDVRDAASCPAIDAYRQSLVAGAPIAPPAPASDCPATFGNSDIFGARVVLP
jgi:hypothetical protein